MVGDATLEPRLIVDDEQFRNAPVDLPMAVLFGNVPKLQRSFSRRSNDDSPRSTLPDVSLADALDRVLRFPAVGSKQFLVTIGDRSITGFVVRDQMVGPWQVPVADAAVTTLGFKTLHGEAMAMGERSPLALIDPAASARMAIGEALTNLASVAVEDLSRVVLSANWMAAAGRGNEDQALFDAVTAVGMELCPALGIAIPVGKDSLSMHTQWRDERGEHVGDGADDVDRLGVRAGAGRAQSGDAGAAARSRSHAVAARRSRRRRQPARRQCAGANASPTR